MTSSHTESHSVVLVDLGHEVVRVQRDTYPANTFVALTFMRPASEGSPAQSFHISLFGDGLRKFLETLTDDQETNRG